MRILIVDDHILFREGLVGLLKSQPDIQIVGQCGSVAEAIETGLQLKPEIILMDFSLPDGTGLEATRAILQRAPDIQIIFLTINQDDEALIAAMRAGAKGYLLKTLSVQKLLTALRAMEKGEAALSRTMMARILKEFAHTHTMKDEDPSPLVTLTSREIEVLQEISAGITNQEIANRLFISENTVKNHVHNILEKLNLNNRREAIDFARRNGISALPQHR